MGQTPGSPELLSLFPHESDLPLSSEKPQYFHNKHLWSFVLNQILLFVKKKTSALTIISVKGTSVWPRSQHDSKNHTCISRSLSTELAGSPAALLPRVLVHCGKESETQELQRSRTWDQQRSLETKTRTLQLPLRHQPGQWEGAAASRTAAAAMAEGESLAA